MDKLIPNTIKVFQLFGICLFRESRIFSRYIRSFFLLLVILNAVFAFYRMFVNLKHFPMDIVHCLFLQILLLNQKSILRRRERMREVFSACSRVLRRREKEEVQKQDLRFISVLAFTVFVCVSYMTFFTLTFNGHSVLSVAYGYSVEKETQTRLVFIIVIVTPFWCFYLFSAYWTCVIYYTLIQYLLKQLARNSFRMVRDARRMVEERMMEEKGKGRVMRGEREGRIMRGEKGEGRVMREEREEKDMFEEILIRFKLYNDLVDEVNDCLSVIPFVTLADVFVTIILVISFVVIYDAYLTVSFVVFTFGFMIAFKLTLLHFSIKLACDSYDQMKQVKKETVDLLSSTGCEVRNDTWSNLSLFPSDDTWSNLSLSLSNDTWSNLSLFLSKKSISKATAWNLFKMRRTILLSLAESIIPFAVMIITTCIEFKNGPKVV